ncbi:hypothetical protein [Bacillus sp. FJAT-27251]|uniref:YphA family membrane protein n=1 Tax=Bacillus sp. FJAT-27251 TaxID=1684142 RepID=UPI0006A77C94|nr:hypothetical protein [Bacillus sp. FJAT-27251]
MEGILFYWIAWIGWVWATFFMDKSKITRGRVSYALLLLIISAPYEFYVGSVLVHAPAVLLFLFFIIESAKMSGRVFISVFLTSFIMMLGYVSFLLFELYDPVWVVFDRRWMLSFCAIGICALIQDSCQRMTASLVLGMIQGEVLFSILMRNLSFSYPVASSPFLDTLALALFIIAVWAGMGQIAASMGNYINHGRGKQNSS